MGGTASKQVQGDSLMTTTTMAVKDLKDDSHKNNDLPSSSSSLSKKPLRKRKHPTQPVTDLEQSHQEESTEKSNTDNSEESVATPSKRYQSQPILSASSSDLRLLSKADQHPGDDSSKPSEETASLMLSEDERDAIQVLQHLNALAHPPHPSPLVYPHVVWPQHQLPAVVPFVQSSSELQPRPHTVSSMMCPHQQPPPPTTTSNEEEDGIQLDAQGYRTNVPHKKNNKRRNGERGADKRPRAPRHCKRCLTHNGSSGTSCLGRTKRGVDACQHFDASGQAKAWKGP
jgi:hypothetical protein